MKQKHYSYTITTKKNKHVDITRLIYATITHSGFTNGLITLYTPHPECSLTLRNPKGNGGGRDLGVALTIPFHNQKPILPHTARVFLVDSDKQSTRRKIHLVVVGE